MMLDMLEYPPAIEDYRIAAIRTEWDCEMGYKEAIAALAEAREHEAEIGRAAVDRALAEVMFWVTERYAAGARLAGIHGYQQFLDKVAEQREQDGQT